MSEYTTALVCLNGHLLTGALDVYAKDNHCSKCGAALPDPLAPCPKCRPVPGDVLPGTPESQPDATKDTGSFTAVLGPDQRYEIISTLGKGGMGTVYKVQDRELDEVLAIKVLDETQALDPAAVEPSPNSQR